MQDGAATYTPGISEKRGTTSKFYHGDTIGSTGALTNSSQSSTDTLTYDAWGNATQTGSSVVPFGYGGGQGYQSDTDSGLKLLGNRYYDSDSGRFLSADPAQNGNNWYAYAGNNPLRHTDPSGLTPGGGDSGSSDMQEAPKTGSHPDPTPSFGGTLTPKTGFYDDGKGGGCGGTPFGPPSPAPDPSGDWIIHVIWWPKPPTPSGSKPKDPITGPISSKIPGVPDSPGTIIVSHGRTRGGYDPITGDWGVDWHSGYWGTQGGRKGNTSGFGGGYDNGRFFAGLGGTWPKGDIFAQAGIYVIKF